MTELRPEYPVTTERLLLRPVELADIDEMLTYRGRPDVCRYLPFGPQTAEHLRGRYGPDSPSGLGRRELTAEGQALTLAVVLRESGLVIGDIILMYKSELDRFAELGYVFHPSVYGHGYATEASKALLDLAFGPMGLHRIAAELDARNTASAALCQRLGMRQEAHFVENEFFKGEWSDLLVYAILSREWSQRGRSHPSGGAEAGV